MTIVSPLDPLGLLSIAAVGIAFLSSLVRFGNPVLDEESKFSWLSEQMINVPIVGGIGNSQVHNITRRVEKYLLGNDPEQIKLFKQSFTESYTMIGVAGAIVGQLGFSGLALDKLDQTHWTAYALFIVSMIAGCLAVYFSCQMQIILSGLHGPNEIIIWLTRPQSLSSRKSSRGSEKQNGRVASANAALMLSAPARFLGISLGAFLVGMGVYLGFLYSRHLADIRGANAGLAILIIYIISTTFFLMLHGYPSGMKILETLLSRSFADALDLNDAGDGQSVHSSYHEIAANHLKAPARTGINYSEGAAVDIKHNVSASMDFARQDRLVAALTSAIRAQEEQLRAHRVLLDALGGKQNVRRPTL